MGRYPYRGRRYGRAYSPRVIYKRAPRRKRVSSIVARARRVGRAATKQALNAYRQLSPQAFKDTRTAPFDLSTLTGQGDYSWGSTPPSWGARIGAWAGDKLGGLVGRVTGLGDYEADAGNPMPTINPPVVRNISDRSVVISHREYIGDVVTSATPGAFNLMSFQVNPGNPVVFPWLSRLAPCFQEYKMNGMLFQFKSMSADALNSTNTALGQVIAATNYNVAQDNYQSKFEMENTEFGSSCKPSVSFMHPIETDSRQNVMGQLYVAAGGTPPAGADPQFYNLANFQLATNGFQGASVNIGELWVTYEVILRKPIQPEAQGESGDQIIYLRGTSADKAINAPITPAIFSEPTYVYPAGSLNPSTPSGLDYYISTTDTANLLSLTSANNPQTDTSLVGRCFLAVIKISCATAGAFTQALSAIGAPILSPNATSNLNIGALAAPVNAISVNGSGNSWYCNVTFRVTGPGQVVFGWDNVNKFVVAATNIRTTILLTELPATPFD